MTRTDGDTRVIQLSRSSLDEAVGVLAQAFKSDPLMKYLFSESTLSFESCLKALFHFSCELRFHLNWPLLGAKRGKDLVGVACISNPKKKPWPEALQSEHELMCARIGDEAAGRLERYADITDASRKKILPHHYLAVLGVRPDFQKLGIGTKLLSVIFEMANISPMSKGVMLDTENPLNVGYYERNGFQVIAADKLEELTVWSFFRRNEC